MSQETNSDAEENTSVTAGEPIIIDSSDNLSEKIEDVIVSDMADFEYFGVKFPYYFKNPHFIQLPDGAIILGVDPAYVTMEMKAKWREIYVPELMKLTHQVLEKLTGEKITSR